MIVDGSQASKGSRLRKDRSLDALFACAGNVAAGFVALRVCLTSGARIQDCSERTVREELAIKRDHCAGATFRIFDFLDVHLEVDGADDAVTKLFVNQGF